MIYVSIGRKMKQIFIGTFLLFSFITSTTATEKIEVLWAFNIGSNQANSVRLILDNANKAQSKYNFILVPKSGAGGTIAANTVENQFENTLVAMSSSFIIRPYFEKDKTIVHNLDNYLPILVQAEGTPIVATSKKYNDFNKIDQNDVINIGVAGIGSLSYFVGNILVNKKLKNAKLINYIGSIDACNAAAGQHINIALGFYSDCEGLIDSKNLNIIGYTGKKDILNYKNLLFEDLNQITASYAIFASKKMSSDKFSEIHVILSEAQKNQTVIDSYKKDFLTTKFQKLK